MSNQNAEIVSVRIIPNEKGNPPGKLADAELLFGPKAGPLSGTRFLGFGIWKRRDGEGYNVTFPARSWENHDGVRQSFALFRAANGDASVMQPVKDLILAAFSAHECQTN